MGWVQGASYGNRDLEALRLIINVETTPATTPNDNMIEVVHRSLELRNVLPSEHLLDKGYTNVKMLVARSAPDDESATGYG